MLYTIGFEESYDEVLGNGEPVKKLGYRPDFDGEPYFGGIVFSTATEASNYIDHHEEYRDGFAVYELDGEWNVHQLKGEDFFRTKIDRVIRRKLPK
jgi:hypothetical protein